MKATEALRLTEQALQSHSLVVEPFLSAVYNEIKRVAGEGRREIQLEWAWQGKRGVWPSANIQAAICKQLIADGYVVELKDDPDPGNPCSHDYWSVRW